MEWVVLAGRVVIGLVAGFIVGTLALWFCSYSVSTENRNIKTAAICNGIITALWAILIIISLVVLQLTESGAAAALLFVSYTVALLISFLFVKGMYRISFWATVWLIIATWFVDAGVEKLIEFIFSWVPSVISGTPT